MRGMGVEDSLFVKILLDLSMIGVLWVVMLA